MQEYSQLTWSTSGPLKQKQNKIHLLNFPSFLPACPEHPGQALQP